MKREILILTSATVLTFAIVPVATADLTDMGFNLTSEYTGSPYWDGQSINNFGGFTVGAGIEWTGPVEDVYDYSSGAVLVGWIQHTFDIGEDYIEMTSTWVNSEVNGWSFLSLLPGDFYGYHISWDGAANIASASLSVGGNPVNMGDLNLYEGEMEDWVDSYIFDPQSDDRITINDGGLDINMQGIAWEYDNIAGNVYSRTSRIEFTFIPAPSALALLGFAGLARRRRL